MTKKLRFYSNKNFDKEMIKVFLKESGGGINFGKGIVKIHPQLKQIQSMQEVKEKKELINKYTDFYYKNNKKSIQKNIDRIRTAWRKVEKKYQYITENYFENFKLNQKNITAYASIINCNPRFIESKTFQFYYKKTQEDAIHTIAHEILHFYFFDFINLNFKKESTALSDDKLWDLSEIFNYIVLKSDKYSKIINKKFITHYPDHKPFLNEFENAYKNSFNAKDFIKHGIGIIQ